MARKNSQQGASQDWKETVFVNYRLSREEKAEFEKWSSRKETDVALDVATFMSAGAKTSVTWDDANKVWIVSSVMKDQDHKSYNQCLTSRSDDWYEAIRLNAYKGLVLAGKDAWATLSEGDNWG